MAEKKIKWTDQQLRAIVERGSDILVTASAGTGKTAVLSGRCVSLISDKLADLGPTGILVIGQGKAISSSDEAIVKIKKWAISFFRKHSIKCV